MTKYGYFTDYCGATRKVRIIAEIQDGRLLISHPSFGAYAGDYILVKKKEVKGEQEE